jgi:hypothetical protein
LALLLSKPFAIVSIGSGTTCQSFKVLRLVLGCLPLLLLQVVGDETLAERFIESNETLRRGIMFSASLYL